MSVSQYIYAESPLHCQVRKQARIVIHADEYEQGVERDRGKGIGRHTVDLARFSFHRDYSYPCGEVAHNASKLLRCQSGRAHTE